MRHELPLGMLGQAASAILVAVVVVWAGHHIEEAQAGAIKVLRLFGPSPSLSETEWQRVYLRRRDRDELVVARPRNHLARRAAP